MSGSHFLSWADCCSSHMRFTVSAEPDETGALIITPAFDMLSDGKTHQRAQSYLDYQDTHADGSEYVLIIFKPLFNLLVAALEDRKSHEMWFIFWTKALIQTDCARFTF